MLPVENERWLEIVGIAMEHRRLQEEAVIAATRRMTDFYEQKKMTGLGTVQGESIGERPRRYRQTTITEMAANQSNRIRGRGTQEEGDG